MPYGFIGNASKKYLTSVNDSLTSAHASHSKNPLAGRSFGKVGTPAMPGGDNHNAPYPPDSAVGGGYTTGVGNETNVVLEQSTYDEILQKIRKTDMETAENLYRIAEEIEKMCETIYIVPATLPKYLAIIDAVKASLNEFQSLTDASVVQTYQFVEDIMEIDGE